MASEKGLAYQLDWGDQTMNPPPPPPPRVRRPPLTPPPPLSALPPPPPPPLPLAAPRAVKARLGSGPGRAGRRSASLPPPTRPRGLRGALALALDLRPGARRGCGGAEPERRRSLRPRGCGLGLSRQGGLARPHAAPPPVSPRRLHPQGRANPQRRLHAYGHGSRGRPSSCGLSRRPTDPRALACPRRAASERWGPEEAFSLEAAVSSGLKMRPAGSGERCQPTARSGEAAGAAQA
ncbi:uncharacterized protein LOC141568583 [Rhinolophus sinicus]|uniref:uncharacterized protein LOC141568583 n=1 Tax=Rhinolophus sinicus TaxID=89399 RepID=UPI003D7A2323